MAGGRFPAFCVLWDCLSHLYFREPDVIHMKKKFLLRLDAELFESLEKWANEELRSVNAQMEYLLTEAVRKAGRLHLPGAHVRGEEEQAGE